MKPKIKYETIKKNQTLNKWNKIETIINSLQSLRIYDKDQKKCLNDKEAKEYIKRRMRE